MWLDRPNKTPEQPVEDVKGEMTTSEVMWYIRAKNTRATNAWLLRHRVHPHAREPGLRGENLYWRKAVVAAKENMLGQGKGGGYRMHKKRRGEVPQ